MNRVLSFACITLLILSVPCTPISAQIPTDGLVAYYPFTGNANDESGNGNHGTVIGASLTSDRFGNQHQAYRFDGSNDLISVPSSPSLESVDSTVTLAVWVNVLAWDNTWAGVAAKSTTVERGQYGIAFQPGGRVDVDLAGTYLSFFTGFQFTLSTWYFLCMSWDGSTVVLYANGNIIGTSNYAPTPMSNSMPLEIGRHTPTNTEYMNGILDDMRIYGRALSCNEMDELYREGGLPPISEGLLAYYPFNGNADDVSGNGNHGSLMGGATATMRLTIGDNSFDALSLPHVVLDGLSDFTFTAVVQIDNVHTSGGHLVAANSWISGAASFHPGGNGFNIVYDGTVQHWRILIVPPFQTNYFFDYDIRMEDHLPHHVAVSRDGDEARLYLDGYMIGNPTIVPMAELECDPNGFIIGQDQDFVGGGFDGNQSLAGAVDNLRIYSRALTASEVLEISIQDGIVLTSAEKSVDEYGSIPQRHALEQNYPNPFNPTTTIRYAIAREQRVKVEVYSILGQIVATLVDATVPAGYHSLVFDGSAIGSGTYFYRMETENFTVTRKFVLLK